MMESFHISGMGKGEESLRVRDLEWTYRKRERTDGRSEPSGLSAEYDDNNNSDEL